MVKQIAVSIIFLLCAVTNNFAETLYKAFAFGTDTWTRTVYNDSTQNYIKINKANSDYTAVQGYGYTQKENIVYKDYSDFTNNELYLMEGENDKIYNQYIGISGPGSMLFRVDVPNGYYRFVAAGGNVRAAAYYVQLDVHDGGNSDKMVLINKPLIGTKEFYCLGFKAKIPPPGDGVGRDPSFLSLETSPIFQVTNGYVVLRQTNPNTNTGFIGGTLCLFELWRADDQTRVSVQVEDALASEEGTNIATFRITRSNTSGDLSVSYSLSGTAVNGVDYTSLPGVVTIADGQNSAIVSIAPIDDSFVESTETITLTIASADAYGQFTPYEATVTISDDEKQLTEYGSGAVTVIGGVYGYVRPDEAEYARIIFKPPESGVVEVKLYDQTGHLIWEQSKSVSSGVETYIDWQCIDENNDKVVSGIYEVIVSGPGINEKKRIAVVR